ncbi:uncharacterized protein LOC131021008 isoform X1 [Salvia miltiorrhiza]|uniref:uncharacterized protein LOC131021008 isoform X1 n=1 Tax=Salvia miltiorrhiza TaxID=226208 RepID=UPI0025ACF328|nr:uncharacterized protein LOC131021008 isoform X1 [Salvia miltiorrhiza]
MGLVAGNEQEKSQLAKTICELSACANPHHPRTNKSHFINWYLVLNVDENADTCIVRRQYHKLALQLHPDKNSNSMAETAFKLVAEVKIMFIFKSLSLSLYHVKNSTACMAQAYLCLSDSTRRRAFETERKTISCIKCNPNSSKKIDAKPSQEASRNSRLLTRMRELRARLAEESTIIDKCLMANAASRREPANALGTRKESPIFNPSDYQHKSYPHHRTAAGQKRLEDLRAALKMGNTSFHNGANQDYPIFQCRKERVPSMSRCASTRDY